MFIKHTRKHSLSETWQNLHSPFARLIPCNFVFVCAIVFLHCKLNFDMPSLIVRSACPPYFVLILSATRPSNCYAAIVAHLPLALHPPSSLSFASLSAKCLWLFWCGNCNIHFHFSHFPQISFTYFHVIFFSSLPENIFIYLCV